MSSNANLPLLKEAFQPLMTIRDSVAHLFELLEAKTVQLKQCYGEYIRQSSNDSLVFGLDSFHFQGKLIDLEFQDMRRMFMAIDNRMYGEYYKLRKWMRQSCESLVGAHPTAAANNHNHNNHHISTASTAAMRRAVVFKDELEGEVEVYRDLEPYRVYSVEHLLRLHDDILRVLQWMNELIEEKELQLRHHQEKEHVGLNINNFVHSFRFEITIIREKQRLFVSFLEFFHTLHVKYLERVAAKVELMYEQLNHDIQWDPHVGHPALRTTIAAGTSGTATAATAAAAATTTHTHPSFVPMKPSARILPTNLTTTAAASIPSNLASSTRSSPSPSSQPEDKQEPIIVQEKEKKTARWKTTMQKMKQAVAQSTVSRSASSESLAHPSIESFARAPPTSPAASMSSVTTSTSLASPSPSPASTSPASTSSPSSTKADTSSVAAAATDTPAFCASDWIARRMRASRDDSVEDVKVGMMAEMAENRNEESWKDEGKSTGEQAADLSFQDIYVQSA